MVGIEGQDLDPPEAATKLVTNKLPPPTRSTHPATRVAAASRCRDGGELAALAVAAGVLGAMRAVGAAGVWYRVLRWAMAPLHCVGRRHNGNLRPLYYDTVSSVERMRMCLNRKVLIGLALVAGAVLLRRPSSLGPALPLLLVAACPLSMLGMVYAMRRQPVPGPAGEEPSAAGTDDEVARLRAEVDGLRARAAAATGEIDRRPGEV